MIRLLTEHFQDLTLDADHEGYYLGRGAKESSILRLWVKTWHPLSEDAPDDDFRSRYGSRGERLEGWVLWPLLSPRGGLIGFAGRKFGEKTITRYLLPDGAWNPIWTGLTPDAMQRIWDGGDVWVVEGMFDLLPLEWVVPECDVVLGSERSQLTDKHVEFLRRYIRRPGQQVWMVYDNDEPGQKGMLGWVDETGKKKWGAVQRLERVKVTARVMPYQGKDPGDVWSRGGVTAVKAMFL